MLCCFIIDIFLLGCFEEAFILYQRAIKENWQVEHVVQEGIEAVCSIKVVRIIVVFHTLARVNVLVFILKLTFCCKIKKLALR